MITVKKVEERSTDYDYTQRYEYKGLSTDTKPTTDVGVNSLFLELDTGSAYYFDGTDWQEVG